MSRQHAAPILVPAAGRAAPLPPAAADWSEDRIQALVHDHPACLPIREIDPLFADPVPLCREMNTAAGSIDNVMVTPSGLPVLVECKLWRNPQARREVIGQILDYATALSRWTASDLQREVSRRTGRTPVELVQAAGHDIDEIGFTDALTHNLRRGRFLLLIVGDGIREGVEAIAEYLQAHSGLHFTLGLVEMPVFELPDGGRLVAPRVLARTSTISREVIALPDTMVLAPDLAAAADTVASTPDDARRFAFMQAVVDGLVLDDPDQPPPRLTPKGYLYLYLPAPASSCWISVLDKRSLRRVGVRLTSNVGTVGETAIEAVVSDWRTVRAALGGAPVLDHMNARRFRVDEMLTVTDLDDPVARAAAVDWLRERINAFVSVFRPRIRDAVANLQD